MSDKIIEMIDVNKWFGDFQVLKDINLTVLSKTKNCCMWSFWLWQIHIN